MSGCDQGERHVRVLHFDRRPFCPKHQNKLPPNNKGGRRSLGYREETLLDLPSAFMDTPSDESTRDGEFSHRTVQKPILTPVLHPLSPAEIFKEERKRRGPF
ncbi:hypothetical protein SRHO_G00033890 [Serrasalmus rhombeus]